MYLEPGSPIAATWDEPVSSPYCWKGKRPVDPECAFSAVVERGAPMPPPVGGKGEHHRGLNSHQLLALAVCDCICISSEDRLLHTHCRPLVPPGRGKGGGPHPSSTSPAETSTRFREATTATSTAHPGRAPSLADFWRLPKEQKLVCCRAQMFLTPSRVLAKS